MNGNLPHSSVIEGIIKEVYAPAIQAHYGLVVRYPVVGERESFTVVEMYVGPRYVQIPLWSSKEWPIRNTMKRMRFLDERLARPLHEVIESIR